MDKDSIIGWSVIAGALLLITFLTLWSRAIINRMAEKRQNKKKNNVIIKRDKFS